MVTAEHHSTVQFIPGPNTHCESHALYMSFSTEIIKQQPVYGNSDDRT